MSGYQSSTSFCDVPSRSTLCILVNAVCHGWVATDMEGLGGRPVPVEDGAISVVWAAKPPVIDRQVVSFEMRSLCPGKENLLQKQ